MATLRAFRPLRYNPARITDLASVVAPPYDVISAAERDALYARDEHNVVRLILNRDADPYRAAAEVLGAWRRDAVLMRESQPALGYYVETFNGPDGRQYERSGIVGVVRLEPFATGHIRPHERTFPSAKEDRMRLLRACRTNLSPIFGLFAGGQEILDPARAAAETASPAMQLADDRGGSHRVWLLHEPGVIEAITHAIETEPIYIADGHHRYETALAYTEQQQTAGASNPHAAHNFILMYLASMHDPGLMILPTHRVLGQRLPVDGPDLVALLRRHFRIVSFARSAPQPLLAALRQPGAETRIGVSLANSDELFLATLGDSAILAEYAGSFDPVVRGLDVTVIDRVVLHGLLGVDGAAAAQAGDLTYTHDDEAALRAVDDGASAAFLLRPPRIADLQAVCLAGQTMPEKSTYFYPKLLTGIVFHPFDDAV